MAANDENPDIDREEQLHGACCRIPSDFYIRDSVEQKKVVIDCELLRNSDPSRSLSGSLLVDYDDALTKGYVCSIAILLVRYSKTGENQYAVIGAARLVLDGIVECIMGRLGSMYDNVLNHLDGRLAQVTEKFSDSTSQHKIDYNTTNNGVCSAIIIDRYVPGDGVMNVLLDGVNLDSSDEEV
ncbi:hypothetical protein IV203_008615 [Nitzschia inconspicua]|uniref:Uncharacterized protein n=1 Tax=Nitzschia inconspicua TaxID=303405 RepID=A0A9K3KZN1_9STRA|nr:hypothetical protein IV203_008615 [Nitzschia inconspicua]